jgi:hypothetical protein
VRPAGGLARAKDASVFPLVSVEVLMITQTRIARIALIAALFAAHEGLLTAQPPAAGPKAAGARVTSVDGRAELTDPAGDVKPIIYRQSVGSGPEKEMKYPGFDVVKLVVSSDGKEITFAATLTTPPANAAHEVIEFYIDADNNPKTGVTHPDSHLLTGVEFYGTLDACLESASFGTMCATTEELPAGHTAVVTLEKYGRDWPSKDKLIDLPAAGKVKEPRKTPIKGPVVQASVDYASMGLKSGQTIRLIAREHSAGTIENKGQGYLPEILMTLK